MATLAIMKVNQNVLPVVSTVIWLDHVTAAINKAAKAVTASIPMKRGTADLLLMTATDLAGN